MADITLSKAVRSNLLSLQNTSNLMGKTQERLATGLKVNSALDNPTNFFTASSLNSRASDLGRLLDSVSGAKSTIEAADKGLSALTKLVESAQATARQALQTPATVGSNTPATSGTIAGGAFTTLDVSGTSSPATAGVNSFAYAADATAFGASDTITFDINVDGAGAQTITIDQSTVQGVGNNDSTIDTIDELTDAINAALTAAGGAAAGATATNDGTNVTITSGSTGTSSSVAITNATADADSGGNANTLYGITDGAGTAGVAATTADSVTFALSVDGTAVSGGITIDAATVTAYNSANSTSFNAGALTAANVVALINDQAGATVAAVNGTTGGIDFTSATTGTSSNITVGAVTESTTAGSTGLSAGANSGVDAASSTTVNPKRADFVSQYNELLNQIDKLAADASFNGVNLLDGDNLAVLFNEDGSSSLNIAGVTFNSTGLGLSSLATTGFDTDVGVNATLNSLSGAMDSLRTQASTFGSSLSVVEVRQNFTKEIINTLESGAANLTLADTNEEAANLLALQTRQQLSSTALSLASQADQQVLQLF